MTQADQILHALKAGQKLTPLKALKQFGCLRLGARVWDLRRAGHKILSETISVDGGKHVAQYWMGKKAA